MPSKAHIPYLNMGPYPCFLGFTMSPKAFRRELKRLDVGETDFLGRSSANATTHILEHPKRETCFIIALRKPKAASVEQVAALVAHEAVHVAQDLWRAIGEQNPGHEAEAYLVQHIVQFCLQEALGSGLERRVVP